MIARIWHGKTKASDADAYLNYLFKSGIPAYRATIGNRGLGFYAEWMGIQRISSHSAFGNLATQSWLLLEPT